MGVGASRAYRRGTRIAALGAVIACALSLPALAATAEAGIKKTPEIQAHRGGTLKTVKGKQKPVLPEETLDTFRNAAKKGFVLELDVKLTADNIPVVMHDASLDRTTNCEGNVADVFATVLRAECRVDLLGTDGNDKPMKANDDRRAPVPTLKEFLKLAKKKGSKINLEIKNIPGEPDFDPTSAYAETVAAAIKASKFPVKKLIVQSFFKPNLDVIAADPYFDKAKLSYLSLSATNTAFRDAAAMAGFDYISPQWPVSADHVSESHELGLKVAPFTVDAKADPRAAAAAGVDAIITNDPLLARKLYSK